MLKQLQFLFLLISLSSEAQIANFLFNDFTEVHCLSDTNSTVTIPTHWEIYQTLNNVWDGPIDSSICINVVPDPSGGAVVALSQIDTSRNLFIKQQQEATNNTMLYPDQLYGLNWFLTWSEGVSLKDSIGCTGDDCTRSMALIQIPDSTGNGSAYREQSSTAYFGFPSFLELNQCFSSERFEDQHLSTVVLSLALNTSFVDDKITLRSIWLDQYTWAFEESHIIDEIVVDEAYFQDTSYNLPIGELNDYSSYNFLVKYVDSTYPSPAYPSFIEAMPNPPVPDQRTINLILEEYQSIVFQPFSGIIGGLVEGSDSLRHHFNLINNGASMCMPLIIEVIFSGQDAYIHHGGDIDFHGNTSCMMFRKGGILEVGKGATLHYGDLGQGILGLGKNARIYLREHSTLSINNTVMLADEGTIKGEQVQVYLEPGSELVFGENARIKQVMGSEGHQRLNVHMLGGNLQMDHLSSLERSYIDIIYPDDEDLILGSIINLSPNPVTGNLLTGTYKSTQKEEVLLAIYALDGKVIKMQHQVMEVGENNIDFPVGDIAQGIYFLKIDGHRTNGAIKFLRQ